MNDEEQSDAIDDAIDDVTAALVREGMLVMDEEDELYGVTGRGQLALVALIALAEPSVVGHAITARIQSLEQSLEEAS